MIHFIKNIKIWRILYLLVPVVLVVICLFFPYLLKFIALSPYILYLVWKDRKNQDLHLFGIHGFVGDVGAGKTMSMVYYLEQMRKKYGDKIYISTNFGYKNEDFPFRSFEELLVVRDKPFIVGWDEVQNEFQSRSFQRFPVSLLTLLTQNRKGHGVQIVYTCQHLSHVDKLFRDMTNTISFCGTILGRYTYYVDCKRKELTKDLEKSKINIAIGRWTGFVQTDKLRDLYDSFQILKSAQNKGYGDTTLEERNVKEYEEEKRKRKELRKK